MKRLCLVLVAAIVAWTLSVEARPVPPITFTCAVQRDFAGNPTSFDNAPTQFSNIWALPYTTNLDGTPNTGVEFRWYANAYAATMASPPPTSMPLYGVHYGATVAYGATASAPATASEALIIVDLPPGTYHWRAITRTVYMNVVTGLMAQNDWCSHDQIVNVRAGAPAAPVAPSLAALSNPAAAPIVTTTTTTTTAPAGPVGLVDLNSATAAQLQTLPGIGPTLATRILDYRAAHGRFAKVEDLLGVSGIGATLFARLKALITVGP